jgi:hypothetical protein
MTPSFSAHGFMFASLAATIARGGCDSSIEIGRYQIIKSFGASLCGCLLFLRRSPRYVNARLGGRLPCEQQQHEQQPRQTDIFECED